MDVNSATSMAAMNQAINKAEIDKQVLDKTLETSEEKENSPQVNNHSPKNVHAKDEGTGVDVKV